MRIATWNINSIRTRIDRVVDWLKQSDVDVLALQETKCKNEQFPIEKLEAAGYSVIAHGFNQWNGVAFVSRTPAENVSIGFDGMPGFSKEETETPPLEARAIGATFNGIRLWSLYVPNGRSLDDPHLVYKLEWLDRLRSAIKTELAEYPELAIMGDFNIAPLDDDCGDPGWFPENRLIFLLKNGLPSQGLKKLVYMTWFAPWFPPVIPIGITRIWPFPGTRVSESILCLEANHCSIRRTTPTLTVISARVTSRAIMFRLWLSLERKRMMTDQCSGEHASMANWWNANPR